MSQHAASHIIDAVEARLATIAPVSVLPLHLIPIEDLPAIVIADIEDETVEQLGPGPLSERHVVSFEVFGVVATGSGFGVTAGELRTQIELALLGTANDVRLGGLCRPGLRREGASFRVDSESLQKPVGGWSMKFQCAYQLKTDAPDVAI
jgi:hypothetical protein